MCVFLWFLPLISCPFIWFLNSSDYLVLEQRTKQIKDQIQAMKFKDESRKTSLPCSHLAKDAAHGLAHGGGGRVGVAGGGTLAAICPKWYLLSRKGPLFTVLHTKERVTRCNSSWLICRRARLCPEVSVAVGSTGLIPASALPRVPRTRRWVGR